MRQPNSRPRHRALRTAPLRSMLTVTSTVAGATLIGLGAAGTTLALWVDESPLNAPVINSGTMSLTVEEQTGTYELVGDWNRMLPGDRYEHVVDVETLGSVDSTIVATANASNNFEVRIKKGACNGTALPPTPASLGTWLAGESSLVCVEVTLAPTAVEGASESVVVDFVATQKAS